MTQKIKFRTSAKSENPNPKKLGLSLIDPLPGVVQGAEEGGTVMLQYLS